MKNQSITIQTIWKQIQSSRKQIVTKLPSATATEHHEEHDDHSEQSHSEIDQNHVWSLSFIFWFAGVVVVYVGYLIFNSLDLIYLIFTGYVLSMAVERMVQWFASKLKGSRGWGIFVSYFIFITVLLSGVLVMVPFLGGQVADIGGIIVEKVNTVQSDLKTIGLDQMIANSKIIPSSLKDNVIAGVNNQDTINSIQQIIDNNMSQIASTSTNYLQGAGGIAVDVVSAIFNALTQIGFVFTLAVLFSIEKDNLMRLIRGIDRKHKSNRHHKISMMYEKLGFWLSSQLLLCLFIFSMTLIGLFVLTLFGLDIPNIFSLALIAGLTEIVPYVGPLLGSVPALLVGTINSGLGGFVGVGALFFVIQWLENNVLIPWIMNKTLGVSSLLIFICMLIGASTLGFVGVLLAVPIAIIISIAME